MVRVGKVEVAPLQEWVPQPGSLVSWQPSPATIEKANHAPVSTVPASYMQAHHLRNYRSYAARGLEMSRMLISAWDMPGRCDIRAMTHVINAHLRRHDTYRSWFEHTGAGHFVRRTISKPSDLQFVPIRHGELAGPDEWRSHLLATPNPLQWDCFRFSIIQHDDHFTFCFAIDHLHCDAMFIGVAFAEIHMMYIALVRGGAPLRLAEAGSYHDYCVRQHQHTSTLTIDSPAVREWAKFFEATDGSLPEFPLPLGDTSAPCEIMGVQLMDERQTAAFESVCLSAGARFCGGVFAISAVVEHELTGADTYYAIVPIDIRRSPADFMTTGWFTGFVPITVPATGSSFREIAEAAQVSFDSGRDLADVPLDRALELVPWLRQGQWGAPLLFYLDAGIPPISAFANSQVEGLHFRICNDGGMMGQIDIRVNRLENETQLTVLFPSNPIARESVTCYAEAMKSAFVRVAEGHSLVAIPRRNGAQVHPSFSRHSTCETATPVPILSRRRTG